MLAIVLLLSLFFFFFGRCPLLRSFLLFLVCKVFLKKIINGYWILSNAFYDSKNVTSVFISVDTTNNTNFSITDSVLCGATLTTT